VTIWQAWGLWRKFSPYINDLEREFRMNATAQKWIQIMGTLISAGTVAAGILPPQYGAIIVAGIGLVKAIAAIRGMHFNPDGTPAVVAYVKEPEK
jgi:hypothetical protein